MHYSRGYGGDGEGHCVDVYGDDGDYDDRGCERDSDVGV